MEEEGIGVRRKQIPEGRKTNLRFVCWFWEKKSFPETSKGCENNKKKNRIKEIKMMSNDGDWGRERGERMEQMCWMEKKEKLEM